MVPDRVSHNALTSALGKGKQAAVTGKQYFLHATAELLSHWIALQRSQAQEGEGGSEEGRWHEGRVGWEVQAVPSKSQDSK